MPRFTAVEERPAPLPAPRPLAPGEQVELWTAPPLPVGGATSPAAPDLEWDVRPARVAFVEEWQVGLDAGGWSFAAGDTVRGSMARLRRLDEEGIAEWEGAVEDQQPTAAPAPAATPRALPFTSREIRLVVTLRGPQAGVLLQRRRSPRLPVGLVPVRIRPLPGPSDEALPVARLTDLSEHGAGVVVDYPMPAGQPVALEFTLPGEWEPFRVRGRVVEPAVPLHGESRPQVDGLPGFRRGIEFLGTAASREYRRLADTLGRRLHP